MRDENGIFVGDGHCIFWQGVEKIENRTCCGGRINKLAYIKCQKKGIVMAQNECRHNICQFHSVSSPTGPLGAYQIPGIPQL